MKRVNAFFKSPIGKTIVWVIGNWLYGVCPLLLMIALKNLSSNPDANKEVHHLINDGLPLFVSCAIMGAVVVDFFVCGDEVGSFKTFWRIIAPTSVVGLLLLVYLLIILKVLRENYFSVKTWLSWFIIGFSVLYCSFAKYFEYKKDTKEALK